MTMERIANRNRCVVFLMGILAVLAPLSFGQVATGTPPFSSAAGGQFDTVNLGNLNVHFAIPVLHKAGRGIPFAYDLTYDSSIWTPVTSSGSTYWQADSNFGWGGTSQSAIGYTLITFRSSSCQVFRNGRWVPENYTIYTTKGYVDRFGVFHPAVIVTSSDPNEDCTADISSGSAATTDGSGYQVSIANYTIATVTSPSGQVIHPPTSRGIGSLSAGTTTDANGNQITENSSGQFFDTLSSSAAVLTISAPAPPSATTFQYTSPSGAQTYSMNYKQYTVATNFGLTGVNEYPATSIYLVDNIKLPDGSKYSFAYEPTPIVPTAGKCTPIGATTCVTARISQVTLNTGGTIGYAYGGGSNGIETDGSTAGLSRQLSPGGTWSYSRTDLSGSHWQTTINDPTTPTNQTVIDFQKDSATTNPTQNVFETQRLVYQGSTSGTLLSTTITCYNGNSVSTPANCASTTVATSILRTTVFRYLPNSSGIQAETDTTFDNFGLPHEVDEYDYGPPAVVGGLIRKTITAYSTLGNGIVDRPSSVTIEDSGNHVMAYTSYAYDETTPTPTTGTPQHVAVTGHRGLLTTVGAEANATATLYRKYAYYDTGTLSTSTDVSTSSTTNGAATTYNYASGTASCGNSFVTSISEPLSLSRSMIWDCNGGVMLSLTDENSKTSSTAYSGSNYTNYFWRPYSTTDQAGTITDHFYYLNTSTPPQPFQTESKNHTAFNSGNSIIDVLTTSDGFGRTIFSQTKQGPSAQNYDTVATCYDSSGRVSLTTMPYSAGAITFPTSCPTSNAGNSTTYDALNRTFKITNTGGGSTAFSYNENDVLQTISLPSKSKQSQYDALGRLRSVCEITSGTTNWPSASCSQNASGTGYLTTYAYDLLGNLTNVTQNAQASSNHQARIYAYDMLGRITGEQNPETKNVAITYAYDSLSGDSACGTITSAGNLLKRTNAAGTAACYSSYDALDRVGTIIYPSTSTPSQKFVYDTATVNGVSMNTAKTRLARAYTCIGTCSSVITDLGFSYSPTGQTTDVYESTPNSGGYYHLSKNYYPNGVAQAFGGMPGIPTITYGVDGKGRWNTVSASSGQNPVTQTSYNPAGQVTGVTFGSGDSDAYQYDPNTGKLSQYTFAEWEFRDWQTDLELQRNIGAISGYPGSFQRR
jgi:YD repeat-containing protein